VVISGVPELVVPGSVEVEGVVVCPDEQFPDTCSA